MEHECWKAFEGATTISKESREDRNTPEAPNPSIEGDDIV
jgi:hypothetical protein